MLKSISNIGTVLSKTVQQKINGGGPGAPGWCDGLNNWGPQNRFRGLCTRNEIAVYDSSLGYCVCEPKIATGIAF